MRTQSATAMASAPPLPPSPITTETTGTRKPASTAIAVQLHKVGAGPPYVVQRVRTLGMAGHLDLLPGRQAGVQLHHLLAKSLLERGRLARRVGVPVIGLAAHARNLLLQPHQRGLEVERASH